MKTIIVIIVTAELMAQTFIGLSVFISSVLEREKRTSIFAGVQFCLMMFFMGKNQSQSPRKNGLNSGHGI